MRGVVIGIQVTETAVAPAYLETQPTRGQLQDLLVWAVVIQDSIRLGQPLYTQISRPKLARSILPEISKAS